MSCPVAVVSHLPHVKKKRCGEYFLQFLDVVRPEDLARAAKSRVDLKGMATLEAQ